MKSKFSILTIVLCAVLCLQSMAQKTKEHVTKEVEIKPNYKQIIGYVTSWEHYKRGGLAIPQNIDFSKYTIVNYSFFQTDTLGKIWGTDEWGDSILLRGQYDWGNPVQPAFYPNTSLIDLAHVAGTKIMLSIGGWTLSEAFPKMAATQKGRSNFAHNCVGHLARYGFDGIDIDWEYPCYEEHKGTPADKENFTLLLKTIRDSIDAYGAKIKTKFLLTAAFGAQDIRNQSIEWDKLKEFMDYFNIMTYDINGAWSENASHNSPLSAPAEGDTNSLENCFKRLVQKYNVPASMINMGVPFYGRSLKGKEGIKLDLYGKIHSGQTDDETFVPDLGGANYYNIMLNKDKFEDKWDEKAQVPYMVGKNINTFLSYDNPESIKRKAQFVNANDAAGVIIWEISGDFIEKTPGDGVIGSTPLIDALNETLLTPQKKSIPKRWREPSTKVQRENGWRAKAVKQNFKNIFKKETPATQASEEEPIVLVDILEKKEKATVAKEEKEKGWRTKAIMQNLKNIYKKDETAN